MVQLNNNNKCTSQVVFRSIVFVRFDCNLFLFCGALHHMATEPGK